MLYLILILETSRFQKCNLWNHRGISWRGLTETVPANPAQFGPKSSPPRCQMWQDTIWIDGRRRCILLLRVQQCGLALVLLSCQFQGSTFSVFLHESARWFVVTTNYSNSLTLQKQNSKLPWNVNQNKLGSKQWKNNSNCSLSEIKRSRSNKNRIFLPGDISMI